MQRLIFSLCLTSLFFGCSVIKKGPNTENLDFAGIITEGNLTRLNVTSFDFDIQKIEIEIITPEETRSLLANLKYRSDGQYLISIRTKLGMEIARINLRNDSIFFLDRINQILYESNSNYLFENLGLDVSFISVIFGDVVLDKELNGKMLSCNNGNSILINKQGEISLEYNIDCSIKRPIQIIIKEFTSIVSTLRLSSYFKVEDYLFPSKVYFSSTIYDFEVLLDYSNIILNPTTRLIFNVPGDIERSNLY